jgi:molybdopterin molybdotransferase
LDLVPVEKFLEMLASFPALGTEEVLLDEASGRVLAGKYPAREDLPLTDRSCMDGFAVRAADTFGAAESAPAWLEVVGEVAVDRAPDFSLSPGRCARIPTGGSLPAGADAVVMVEYTEPVGEGEVEISRPVHPGENVMLAGEDAAAGSLPVAPGTRLRPQEAGVLAALGHPRVLVHRRPVCAVISTGDELVEVDRTPAPGQVRDVNTTTVSALVAEAKGLPLGLGIVADDLESLSRAVDQGLFEADVVLISGGSSIGVRDLTVAAIESFAGARILAHGVMVRPGKPTILAEVPAAGDRTGGLVIGLPGQVTSAQVVMKVFVQPLLASLSGDVRAFDESARPMRQARLARNVDKPQGREDYLRVRLVRDPDQGPGGLPLAEPRLGASGLIRTLVEAHGLVRIPAGLEGLAAGTLVQVWLI